MVKPYTCALHDIPHAAVSLDLPVLQKIVVTLIARGDEDPEVAHSLEDKLLAAFVDAVAAKTLTDAQLADAAAELVKLRSAPFPRWHA